MTQHWNDVDHTDCIMVIGGNPAENHPIAFNHMTKAMNILESQGYTLRRVYVIPYRPQDIFGADILATSEKEFKFVQVTNRQYDQRRGDKMKVPMPRWVDRELWVWKDKKDLFYVYDTDGNKLREEFEGPPS